MNHDHEEQVLREALRQQAEAEDFEPLDSAQVRSQARRRIDWGRGLQVAAAAALVVGLGAVVVPLLGGQGPSAPVSAVPASAEAGTAAAGSEAAPEGASGSEVAPDDASGSGGPVTGTIAGAGAPTEPAEGFRWESFRDVMVQVPDDWGYDFALNTDWCAEGRSGNQKAKGAFVDLNRGDLAVAAIGCLGDPPGDRQAMHLSFRPADSPEEVFVGASGWKAYDRSVGAARLIVVARPTDADLAQHILDSAVQVGTDQNGCPVALPETGTPDLSGLTAEEVAVCLYADTDAPNLHSSVLLRGAEASAAIAAIQDAPGGGGPDGDPAECGTMAGSRAVVLVDGLASGLTVGACTGNGLADASATGGQREVTAELCRSLLVSPVLVGMGSGPTARFCVGLPAR